MTAPECPRCRALQARLAASLKETRDAVSCFDARIRRAIQLAAEAVRDGTGESENDVLAKAFDLPVVEPTDEGFWGRAAARLLIQRKKAEARIAAAEAERGSLRKAAKALLDAWDDEEGCLSWADSLRALRLALAATPPDAPSTDDEAAEIERRIFDLEQRAPGYIRRLRDGLSKSIPDAPVTATSLYPITPPDAPAPGEQGGSS